MVKKYSSVSKDQFDKLVSDGLDVMWNDDASDAEIDELLKMARNEEFLNKLSSYQYAKNIINDNITSDFFNVVKNVKCKINNSIAKENKKYEEVSNARGIFWPFSIPALALCALFFIVLSVNDNYIKKTNYPVSVAVRVDKLHYSHVNDNYEFESSHYALENHNYNINELTPTKDDIYKINRLF